MLQEDISKEMIIQLTFEYGMGVKKDDKKSGKTSHVE